MTDPLQQTSAMRGDALGVSATRLFEVSGVLPPTPRLAIVGSRAARFDRISAVRAVAQAARDEGLSIVSGGALGIDTAAHLAALELGVPQVVVLPCGPDRPYPTTNIDMFRAIVRAGGAVVYGRPRGATPNRAVFASRNAIVVGLATRLLVAQVHLPSGSFGTAQLALSAGKPVAAIGGQPAATALAGKGACLLPFEPGEGVALQAAVRQWLHDKPVGTKPWPAELQALKTVVAAAGPGGVCIDVLEPGLLVHLLRAEADGWVGERTPGRYVALR